jgi:hypothetical protein
VERAEDLLASLPPEGDLVLGLEGFEGGIRSLSKMVDQGIIDGVGMTG